MEHDITLHLYAHKRIHRWADNNGIYKHLRYILMAAAVAMPLTACNNNQETTYQQTTSTPHATYETPQLSQTSYHQPPLMNDPQKTLLPYRITKKERKNA